MPIEITPSRKLFLTNYPSFRYWKKKHIENLNQDKPLSLYIHIPFCSGKCAFCYYLTHKYKNQEQVNRYADALCSEINTVNSEFDLSKRKIDSVYFGGGTPSLLNDKQLANIINTLNQNFDLTNDVELTIEINPNLVNTKKVGLLNDLGFNRISMGVQSFDDNTLKLSERKHTSGKAEEAVNILLSESNASVNIDLLSGLAGDNLQTWEQTIRKAVDLKVHNITVYKLQTYSNTGFYKKGVRKEIIDLPSDDEEVKFMSLALDVFEQHNYKPLTYFTFGLSGDYDHKYVNNIWNNGDLYSFGISGFGNLGNTCFQNTSDLEKYYNHIDNSEIPLARGYKLSLTESLIRYIVLRMKLCTLNTDEMQDIYGINILKIIPDVISELTDQDYISIDSATLSLTRKGLLFGDYAGARIAHGLKEYFKMDKLLL